MDTEKIKQRWETWSVGGCTFDVTIYRARMDSRQLTLVFEQYNDDLSINKRWRKSLRGDTSTEADKKAEDEIERVKRAAIEAVEEQGHVL